MDKQVVKLFFACLFSTVFTTMGTAQDKSKLIAKELLGKRVSILIPHDFKLMRADQLSIKYPLKSGNQFAVYTNKDGNINVAIEHSFSTLSLNELNTMKNQLEQQFSLPEIELIGSRIKKINNREFIVLEMITPAVDTKVYNLMFVTSLDERLFIGTFNCTVDQMKTWKPIAAQIAESVKILN